MVPDNLVLSLQEKHEQPCQPATCKTQSRGSVHLNELIPRLVPASFGLPSQTVTPPTHKQDQHRTASPVGLNSFDRLGEAQLCLD